jgi:hypothetical protein
MYKANDVIVRQHTLVAMLTVITDKWLILSVILAYAYGLCDMQKCTTLEINLETVTGQIAKTEKYPRHDTYISHMHKSLS